jgi:hypothetical protein
VSDILFIVIIVVFLGAAALITRGSERKNKGVGK